MTPGDRGSIAGTVSQIFLTAGRHFGVDHLPLRSFETLRRRAGLAGGVKHSLRSCDGMGWLWDGLGSGLLSVIEH